MIRVLIVDHFDSFSHNLLQCLGGLGAEVVVRRSDSAIPELLEVRPDRVVLSPGPGRPADAGVFAAAALAFAGRVPVLGVCLGHQVLAEVFGGAVTPAPEPIHGKPGQVTHDGRGVFAGLPSPLEVARYHSLAVHEASLPPSLEVSATCGSVVMGLRHVVHAVEGIQFHPESVLTPSGNNLLANFLHPDGPGK